MASEILVTVVNVNHPVYQHLPQKMMLSSMHDCHIVASSVIRRSDFESIYQPAHVASAKTSIVVGGCQVDGRIAPNRTAQ